MNAAVEDINDAGYKPRLLVLTDISSLAKGFAEPDDTQSMVRLLLYANEIDIEGLVATYTKHGHDIRPAYLHHIVKQYGKVQPQLALHDPRFPTEARLRGLIKSGNPKDGLDQVGAGKDTEGSDWIIEAADREDVRPLWVSVWGGTTDLAQALWKVRTMRSKEQLTAFIDKLRVYAIGDQYGIGSWIRDEFPGLFYITCYKAFRGMSKKGDTTLTTIEWLRQHIVRDHGPFGESYPEYDGGDPWGNVYGMKEGDSPAFMYLIPNGLGDPERPEWGGWGGRFALQEAASKNRHYVDAVDTVDGESSEWASVYRWRSAFQRSFQARMDWCVMSYEEANHEPVAVIQGGKERTVRAGERVPLSASGSTDPDGEALDYEWQVYPEAGSYQGNIRLEGWRGQACSFIAPEVLQPQTIHVILTVTNRGTPPLSAYKRIIITVENDVEIMEEKE